MHKDCQQGHHTDRSFVTKFDSKGDKQEQFHELLGHPLPCAIGIRNSVLKTLKAAAIHYPQLRRFLVWPYSARNHHRQIYTIDVPLHLVDFAQLMEDAGISHCEELYQSECESRQEKLATDLQNLEPLLQVKHATLITKLDKEVSDDPEYAYCCCKRMHQRKSVTSMKNSDSKCVTTVWQQLKQHKC